MGIRIRELRVRAGVSLRGLAKQARVDFSTIHRIERGDESPRFTTLEKLAKALGVSVRDLIEK
jgi:transcriptional regulator with XRE-family HTH domain